jgi:hypothetical protein
MRPLTRLRSVLKDVLEVLAEALHHEGDVDVREAFH